MNTLPRVADREVVLAAVTKNGLALEYGLALKYASAELKGDRDFVLAAVSKNWRA